MLSVGQAAVACQEHRVDLIGLAQNSHTPSKAADLGSVDERGRHAFGRKQPGCALMIGYCRLEDGMNFQSLGFRYLRYPSGRFLDAVRGIGKGPLANGPLAAVNDNRAIQSLLSDVNWPAPCG
jgi:hypothetical protein